LIRISALAVVVRMGDDRQNDDLVLFVFDSVEQRLGLRIVPAGVRQDQAVPGVDGRAMRGGDFAGTAGCMDPRGYPKVTRSTARSHDRDLAQRLREVSEEVTHVTYNLDAPGG
jgi:hypothetical protein